MCTFTSTPWSMASRYVMMARLIQNSIGLSASPGFLLDIGLYGPLWMKDCAAP